MNSGLENSPGQNTAVGSRSLLQGIFPPQGSNPGLPLGRRIFYQLSHQGNLHHVPLPSQWPLQKQSGKESTCNAGDPSSVPGSRRSSGEGIGYPLHILRLPWWLSWGQCGGPGLDSWMGKIPWRRQQLPTSVFWPGEFHWLYSL